MRRRLTQAAVVLVLVFAAAQLIRPGHDNPSTDVGRAIQSHAGTSAELVAVLDRSCSDCHSNHTVWPWYTEVAPVSWAMAYAVKQGRQAVNFSEWAAYSAERQQMLLAQSCRDVSQGKMPGPYTWIHPEMRLSARDVETICAATQGTR